MYQITAYEILEPPEQPGMPPRKWMAVATAHVYDANLVVPPLTVAQTVLAGETMRAIDGRAYAETESIAMALALDRVLFQLKSLGLDGEKREDVARTR
jgi:hypothetical protein